MMESKLNLESWGKMEWLCDDSIVANAQMSLAKMSLKPLADSPAHRHPNCNEVIHVVRGEVIQRIGDQRTTLKAGDTAFIPAGAVHHSENPSNEEALMIVGHSAGTRAYEPVN
jgi:quercetin dioxygenase-like cupin family protein